MKLRCVYKLASLQQPKMASEKKVVSDKVEVDMPEDFAYGGSVKACHQRMRMGKLPMDAVLNSVYVRTINVRINSRE